MQLRFVPSESTESYFAALRGYLHEHGCPVAFYSDKHSVFRVTRQDAKGGQGMTQFGRALSERLIWRNLTLVRADSPEDAYQEALRLGRAGDTEYDNSQGNRVEVRFRGLSSLDVIHDELENGAELLFTSETGVSEERLASLWRPKQSLGVFSPIRPIEGPDVAAGYIVDEPMRMISDPHTDE